VAVRAVCAVRAVRAAVRLVVYGSAHGSVRLSCCGSVLQCDSACVAVRQRAALRQCVSVRLAVCGGVRGRVRQCVAVSKVVCGSALYVYIYTKPLTIILVCLHRGGGNEPHISRILL
jgi:hypothetical protein